MIIRYISSAAWSIYFWVTLVGKLIIYDEQASQLGFRAAGGEVVIRSVSVVKQMELWAWAIVEPVNVPANHIEARKYVRIYPNPTLNY